MSKKFLTLLPVFVRVLYIVKLTKLKIRIIVFMVYFCKIHVECVNQLNYNSCRLPWLVRRWTGESNCLFFARAREGVFWEIARCACTRIQRPVPTHFLSTVTSLFDCLLFLIKSLYVHWAGSIVPWQIAPFFFLKLIFCSQLQARLRFDIRPLGISDDFVV